VASFYSLCDTEELIGSLGVGRYTAGDLLLLQFELPFDDSVQSLDIIAEGYQVTLFQDDNFQGKSISFTETVFCLRDFGFMDDASSVIIEPGGWSQGEGAAVPRQLVLMTVYQCFNNTPRQPVLMYHGIQHL
jgi:Beta/Gamma crystallin